jgi:hypothetical protein
MTSGYLEPMIDAVGKHVFVSYVHEDGDDVDQLCTVLEAAQIPYWRDRKSLGPGDAWKAEIRRAIRSGSLVFLGCFSDNQRGKDASHMNEELTLAIEEYRKRPPGRTWLIPVRFDSGEVPEWDLGAGRTLSDLNYVELFGTGYPAQAAALVTTIHGVMGDKQLSPAAALEAVEQATDVDRADLLKRLTKEMLLDSRRRIELDDLVSQEVQRVLKTISDPDRVVGPLAGDGKDQIVSVATAARELWGLTKPFCSSLQVAARWGEPEALAPWASGLRSFVQSSLKTQAGLQALLDLRHLPGVVSLMTAGMACVSSQKWGNLKTLVVDPMVRGGYENKPQALLEATDPWAPFSRPELAVHALARASIEGMPLADALTDFTERRARKYHTPVAEWLHKELRPVFSDQFPDDEEFTAMFDRTEAVLGVLAQDAVNVRIAARGSGWGQSRWFGRLTWRAWRYGNAFEDLQQELAAEGTMWGPLRGGLFGGDADRAKAALDKYAEVFGTIAKQRL